MSNYFIRSPFVSGSMILQVALLGGGLVLATGSSGKKSKTAVTIVGPECRVSKPSSFKQEVDSYSLKCRYEGGDPKIKFIKKAELKGSKCPKGTFRHLVIMDCEGADVKLKTASRKQTTPSKVAKLPATKTEKAAMAKVMLEEQNKYRAELNLKPLVWSDRLQGFAEKWAAHLAKLGGTRIVSSNPKTTGQGENIWIGTAGSLSFAEIIRVWGAQKKYFIPGIYPKVSKTGDAADVRNYSQMIWSGTKLVGCGFARAGGNDILVCRYWPPGNVVGHKPL